MEEHELSNEQEDFYAIREVREAKLEKAFSRLARFELQSAPALTSRKGAEKHTLSFYRENGEMYLNAKIEPIEPEEVKELDEALAVINEIDEADPDLVQDVEIRVFDEAKERIEHQSPANLESVEQIKYVADLQDAVGETFQSYEEALEWERQDYGDDQSDIER